MLKVQIMHYTYRIVKTNVDSNLVKISNLLIATLVASLAEVLDLSVENLSKRGGRE